MTPCKEPKTIFEIITPFGGLIPYQPDSSVLNCLTPNLTFFYFIFMREEKYSVSLSDFYSIYCCFLCQH